MQAAALDWLTKHHEDIVHGLAELVAIQSISTDGEHNPEIDRTAKLTCDQMRQAGLHNVDTSASDSRCRTPTASGSKHRTSRRCSCTRTTTFNR
jgi:hypothetical protein